MTVVTNASALCHNMNFSADASAKIVQTLKSVGVETVVSTPIDLGVHANDSLIVHSPPKTLSAHLVDVDLVVNCTGSVPNTQFLPRDLLDARGQVKVNEFLQVSANVFAIGDCADVKEPKNFVNVCGKDYMPGMPVGHSDVVAANIKALAAQQPLTAYTPNSYVAGIIPVGPTASVTVGFPDEYGQYKAASYFYEAQFQFAKAAVFPPKPSL